MDKHTKYNTTHRAQRLAWAKAPTICKVCGTKYSKANKGNHEKTKYHKLMDKMRTSIRQMIIE